MPLKLEQSGCSIDTLEMRVSIIGDHFSYASKPLLADQVGFAIDGTIKRVPPLWCARRSLYLNYYVPSAFLKCVRYSSNFVDFMISVENLVMWLLEQDFLIGTILAILRHFFQVRGLAISLFTYLSYLLRKRLDLNPGWQMDALQLKIGLKIQGVWVVMCNQCVYKWVKRYLLDAFISTFKHITGIHFVTTPYNNSEACPRYSS